MFGIHILVYIKCFVTFLEAHSLQIFLEIFYWLWPAQAGSELGPIYRLWLAQKRPSPAARSSRAGPLASLVAVKVLSVVWMRKCGEFAALLAEGDHCTWFFLCDRYSVKA